MHDLHPLDDPVGASLRGAYAHLGRGLGNACTYLDEVATFISVPPDPTQADWAELAVLLGPGGFADMFSSPATPPEDWKPVFAMEGLQMVTGDHGRASARPVAGRDEEVVELGATDVADMRDLVATTRPGPFWRRTHEMGTYVGIRRRGRLVAMAGQRLAPPGLSEISAVATHTSARGQGLGGHVVRHLVAQIEATGDRPFLHVAADNVAAIRRYHRLGFEVRARQLPWLHGPAGRRAHTTTTDLSRQVATPTPAPPAAALPGGSFRGETDSRFHFDGSDHHSQRCGEAIENRAACGRRVSWWPSPTVVPLARTYAAPLPVWRQAPPACTHLVAS